MSPASSEAQRKLAGIALSMKLGKTPKSYSAQAARMAETMTLEQLREFAHSKVEK